MSKRPFDKARDETPPENNYFVDWGGMGEFIHQKNIEQALKEGAKIVVTLSVKEKLLKELEDAKSRKAVNYGEKDYKPVYLTDSEISSIIRAVVNYY